MTALLVADVFPPKAGGSGRWFWELYRRLPRQHAVVAAGEHAGWRAFDETHDLRLVRLPFRFQSWGCVGVRQFGAYARLMHRLRQICRQFSVRTVHAGCCLPEGFAAWLLKLTTGIPYLLYVHGEEMRAAASSRELSWMARRVLGGASHLVANSQNTARILREEWNVPARRIAVLHPGVDADRFRPAHRNPAVRKRLGWNDRPVVLTVGRLQKRKGHDMLIQAIRSIRERVPEVLYAIVGDGEERAELDRLTDKLNLRAHVQFRGEPSDDDLIDCYQQCDLFVLPNREVNGDIEGFGMVLVEAQACGKAVIAGNSGGTRETMRLDETGLLVDCQCPDELARVVSSLLVDSTWLKRMGDHARVWVEEQFAWPRLLEQAVAVLGLEAVRPVARDHLRNSYNTDVALPSVR